MSESNDGDCDRLEGFVNRRYWLFAYQDHYPSGGMGDFKGSFDSRSDAITMARELVGRYDCIDVLDTSTGEYVN